MTAWPLLPKQVHKNEKGRGISLIKLAFVLGICNILRRGWVCVLLVDRLSVLVFRRKQLCSIMGPLILQTKTTKLYLFSHWHIDLYPSLLFLPLSNPQFQLKRRGSPGPGCRTIVPLRLFGYRKESLHLQLNQNKKKQCFWLPEHLYFIVPKPCLSFRDV